MLDMNSAWKLALEKVDSAFGLHEVIFDEQGQAADYLFLDVNPAFCSMIDMEREEVVGRTATEVMTALGQDAGYWISRVVPVALEGREHRQEFFDNRLGRWWEMHFFSPARNYCVGIANDITLQRQNSSLHCNHFVNTNNLFCLIDLDSGCFMDLNPCWENTLGWAREKLLKKALAEFAHPDDQPLIRNALKQLQAGQEVEGLEVRIMGADGSYRWLLWQARPERESGLVFCASLDMTERVKLLQELKQTSRLYALLSGISHEIVRSRERAELLQKICEAAVEYGEFAMAWIGWLEADSGRVTPIAQAGSHLEYLDNLNISFREEPYNKGPSGVAIVTGQVDICSDFELEERMKPWAESARRQGFRSSAAVPILVNDSTAYVLCVYASEPMFFGSREKALLDRIAAELGYAMSAMQASEERNRFEAEILLLNEDLEQRVAERTADLLNLYKELESFSYSVSHDLRGPLRAIGGYANIICEDHQASLDAEARRMLQIIQRNVKKMGMLIDDLLAFSRLSRQSQRPGVFDMERLFNNIYGELVAEQQTQTDAGFSIEFSVEKLPVAYGDYSMIRQLVSNLLSNAIKFSSQRQRPRIQVGSMESDITGQHVYYVKDNGAGFDPKYSDKIFNVFQRLHNEEEFEGTGVGLAISRRVVERHGGRIWAEGRPDEGATFYFSLPGVSK